MSHPLVLGLFDTPTAAAAGARVAHERGVDRDRISVVSRTHEEEGVLAEAMDATPGADIEDSRAAALLGELSGYVVAAIAIALPGIGPIVAAGPLAADLGEAVGHAAGSMAAILTNAGVDPAQAERVQRAVESGKVLLGVHATEGNAETIRAALEDAGPSWLFVATWPD
jgi:hypothetical protein